MRCWVFVGTADNFMQLSKRDDWGFPKPSDKAAAAAAAAAVASAASAAASSDEDGSRGSDSDDIPPNPNARNAMRCR